MLNGLEGIMSLAAASGEELGTTSDIVTDALTAFGLSAKDSTHFADLLATASSNANTNVAMMGETFKYVAPAAGAMGYSAEDMAEAIGLMANSGIKASQAGTSLRSVITRLATDAGASSTKLGALGVLTKELGVNFFDSNGKARDFGDVIRETRVAWQGLDDQQAATFAKQIAGQNAISGWLALMEASEADVEKLSTAIANCDGTASNMANTMNNNLSGALTIFNSALEGFGIAVYDRISGPLTKVVELGTDVISAITGWLTPAKSDLQAYIDEISDANEQIKTNLETIETTLNKELSETSQLESYKDLFHDVLEDGRALSGLSISDMVTAMVTDMGHLDKDGITVIDEGFLTAAGHVGNLKESDILGGLLESSATEATGLTNGIGEGAEGSAEKIDELADTSLADGELAKSGDTTVEMFGHIDTSAEGSSAKIKEFFAPVANEDTFWISIDNISKKMDVFTEKEKAAADAKGDLLNSTTMQVDHGFLEAIEEIGGGLENIVLITDDFQKRQITKAIEHIAQLKPEARDLWNEQYGILSNNVELLDTLINMEETYLAGQAFAKARAAIYEEQGNAYMAMYQAESAANNALKEINDALENAGLEAFESFEAAKEGFTNMTPEVAAFRQENEQLVGALADASGELENANANITDCTDRLNKVNEAEQYMQEQTGFTVEQVEGFNQSMADTSDSAVGTAEALDGLVEDEEDLTEATEDTAEATEELSKELKKAAEEGIKDNQKALQDLEEEYRKLQEEYEQTIGTIATGELWDYGKLGEDEAAPDLAAMRDTMNHNMEQLQQWRNDMQFLADQVGSSISAGYFSSLLEQGPEGGKLIRALVNDIQWGGGQAKALSDTFDATMGATSGMSDYFASVKMMLENGFTEVAEGLDYAGFWETVGSYLDNPEFWEGVTEDQHEHLDAALHAASSIGAGIPEKLAEGIRDGSINADAAVGVINDIIIERLSGLRDQALSMGATVPDGLIEGVRTGEITAQEAFNGILDSIADYTHVDAQGRAVGEYYLSSVAQAMEDGAPASMEVYDAAGNVAETITEGATAELDATGIGEQIASDTKEGIEQGKSGAIDQAQSMVGEAKDSATNKANDFADTGKTATDKLSQGIQDNKSEVITATDNVMKDAVAKADEWDDDWERTGKDIPAKIGTGTAGNKSEFVNAVDETLRAGVEKAASYSGEFEGKGRELVEAIGRGASGNGVAVQNGVVEALNNAQNVDVSGFQNIGTNITNAVANGIVAGQSTVTTAAQNMAQSAYNAAAEQLQIHSPSRVFRDGIGFMIPRGSAEGVEAGTPILEDAVEKSMASALDSARQMMEDNPLDMPLDVAMSAPDIQTAGLEQKAKGLIDADMPALQAMVRSDLGGVAMQVYGNSTNVEELITENTRTLGKLVDCANLMLDTARAMGEKISFNLVNEIDGRQFDSRIRTVSQKEINQKAKNLATVGGR